MTVLLHGPSNLRSALEENAEPRLRSLAALLIYASVLLRVAAEFDERGRQRLELIWLMAGFGLLMVSEPWIRERVAAYSKVYLAVQTGLVLLAMFLDPDMDFLATLFFPLSFQAVKFHGRIGFLWVGAYSLVMAVPLLLGWNWTLSGLAMVLVFAGINALLGSYASRIQRAGKAHQESQRLLGELEAAYSQLRAYASQVEDLAAARERSSLAQELHDSVTQTLFSMNLTVQAARLLLDQDPSRVSQQLDRLQELAHGAAGELQLLAHHLQPKTLSENSLAAALHLLAEERRARDGLQVLVKAGSCTRESELSEATRAVLYRIVQEALNNIARHAGTCQAVVRLDLDNRPAFVEVVDQGAGFDPQRLERNPGQLGLRGMEARSREIGWILNIDSQPGQGTRVRVEEARNAWQDDEA